MIKSDTTMFILATMTLHHNTLYQLVKSGALSREAAASAAIDTANQLSIPVDQALEPLRDSVVRRLESMAAALMGATDPGRPQAPPPN